MTSHNVPEVLVDYVVQILEKSALVYKYYVTREDANLFNSRLLKLAKRKHLNVPKEQVLNSMSEFYFM